MIAVFANMMLTNRFGQVLYRISNDVVSPSYSAMPISPYSTFKRE
jgi:hypothetical protein